jgi:hypothetical protein
MTAATAPRVRVARGPRRTYLDAAPGERGSGNLRSLVNLAGGGVRLASSSVRSSGGEWDFWLAFSTADRRRLGSLGFTAERLEHPWVAKVEAKVARRLAAQVAKEGS